MKEQISQESPLSLTRYKSSLLHCIPRLRLLAFIVPEKSLTKNLTYLAHVYLELYITSFPIYFKVKTFDPWGGTIFHPRGMI